MSEMNRPKSGTQRYVSLEAGAAYLGVSVATLRRRIRQGDLRARRMGRQIIRVEIKDLDALLRDIPSARFNDRE